MILKHTTKIYLNRTELAHNQKETPKIFLRKFDKGVELGKNVHLG